MPKHNETYRTSDPEFSKDVLCVGLSDDGFIYVESFGKDMGGFEDPSLYDKKCRSSVSLTPQQARLMGSHLLQLAASLLCDDE